MDIYVKFTLIPLVVLMKKLTRYTDISGSFSVVYLFLLL